MTSWVQSFGIRVVPNGDNFHHLVITHQNPTIRRTALYLPVVFSLKYCHNSTLSTLVRSQTSSNSQNHGEEDDPENLVQDLRVPDQWLLPSKALEESEWLRVALHEWLDDEYCPEPTNIEISKVASESYYESLLEKQTDLGVILLKMARQLESISYQESFHGAFSSANAAVNLIVERIERTVV